MTIYFATDHAGFTLKEALVAFVRDELGQEVVDCGAHTFNPHDDYIPFIREAARAVSEDPRSRRAIILGGSGQGEAMCANRFPHVRAGVFYGGLDRTQTDSAGRALSIVASVRAHNDANVLSLAARFITEAEAREAVRAWLETEADPRHQARNEALG